MKTDYKKLLGIFGTATLGGLLGAFAGADGTSKAYRRFGLPILHLITAIIKYWHLSVGFIIFHAIGLSLGYGIPSYNSDGTLEDAGSKIGAFWYKALKNNHRKADLATRMTIGLLKAIPFVIIPILTGKWLIYAIVAVLAILVNVIIGGLLHPKGMITVLKKELLLEEFYIYFGETLLYQILIWI